VNKKLSILDLSRRVRATRLLSFALLILVAYGTTVEAIHTHRNLLRSNEAASSACLHEGDGSTQSRAQSQAGECLACQFQQNLSSAELFTPHLVLAPAVSLPASISSPVSFNSHSQSTGQGRAPPITS
jgi:hypothetical protein